MGIESDSMVLGLAKSRSTFGLEKFVLERPVFVQSLAFGMSHVPLCALVFVLELLS